MRSADHLSFYMDFEDLVAAGRIPRWNSIEYDLAYTSWEAAGKPRPIVEFIQERAHATKEQP